MVFFGQNLQTVESQANNRSLELRLNIAGSKCWWYKCISPLIYPLQSNASEQNTVASLCNRYLSPEDLAPFNRAENDDCFPFLAVLLLWINLLFVLCNLCYLQRLGHGRTNKTFSKCFMLPISQVRRASEVSLANAVMCQKWKEIDSMVLLFWEL